MYFLEYLLLCLDDKVNEESEYFSIRRLRVMLSFRLIFWWFQLGVAYKSVAYKKKRVFIFNLFELSIYSLLK